jgi:hypothetical protein
MKINSAATVSALSKAGVLSVLVCITGLSHFANADNLNGAQVCQPANLVQAQIGGGIGWQSNGVLNSSGSTFWVICGLSSFDTFPSAVSSFVDLRNTTNTAQEIQCVAKTINDDGTVADTVIEQVTLDPVASGFINFDVEKSDQFQSVSISCKLPSGTAVTQISSDPYEPF